MSHIPSSRGVNTCSCPSQLRITDIRVAHTDGLPKHNILLKIYTNQGICGYGEVRDASSATYALMLKSRLVGENPLDVERLFARISQFGGHSRQGGGVSGIEIALYDIIGKAYGIPVFQLLGGSYRDRVRIYCDTDVDGKHTGTDMGRALRRRMDMGFTFLKMDLGIELLYDEPDTLCAPAGMLDDLKKYSMKAISHQSGSIDRSVMLGENYRAFTVPHHATGIHITDRGLDILEDYVRQVRDVIGYEIPLAIDHIGHVALQDVVRLGKRLEKYSIAWMEDVAPWHYTDHYSRIAAQTSVSLCTGEDIYLAENFRPLLESGSLGVVHPDMLTVGGFGEVKKLAHMCDSYGVAMAVHMAESPVGCMAAVHAAAAVKNVLAVEFHSVDHPDWQKVVTGIAEPLIKDGFIDVPRTPGLGITDYNEQFISEHAHSIYGGSFDDSSAWDNEWSNDRTWS